MYYKLSDSERNNRIVWASVRATLERFRFKYKRGGFKTKSKYRLFEKLLLLFGLMLKVIGVYRKGVQNAMNINIENIEVESYSLPQEFNGFRILFLSDLHIDAIDGFEDVIIKKIEGLSYDLCVITGDFRMDTEGSFRKILPAVKKIVDAVKAPFGVLAVLGNHDTYLMVEPFEAMGIRCLINETVFLTKNKARITVAGTDDTYYFYTDKAMDVLEQDAGGFKICLSHTSELCDVAARNNFKLYLCGHTHGGQICLPGGKPVISHQKSSALKVKGLWKEGEMTGYTSRGVGVSGIPLRFNCSPEVTIVTLKQKNR